MAKHKVTIFKPYPFQVGQKIRIEGSTRDGDWEVADVTERKVTLRCPISKKSLHGICSAILRKRRMMLRGLWTKFEEYLFLVADTRLPFHSMRP